MRLRAALLIGCALAGFGCRPWFAERLFLEDGIAFVADPGTPPWCNDLNALTLVVNGIWAVSAGGIGMDCRAGACSCGGPRWSLEATPGVPIEDGVLTLAVSDGRVEAVVRTEDARAVALVGPMRIKRGEERALEFHTVTPPSRGGRHDVRLYPANGEAPVSLHRVCDDCTTSPPAESTAESRLDDKTLYFTLLQKVPPGDAALHITRAYTPEFVECGFARCAIQASAELRIPILVE